MLTGGSSRVSDAMELLADGYGKRLLISGVHPASGASDISRSLTDNQSLLSCCVDLDRSAVNTRSNAAETRRWVHERGFKSLIVVTSNYHMPRAIVELSHAMPDITLIPFAVVGDKWREEPWWSNSATVRLLLSEYVKYVAAEVRVRLADAGLDIMRETADFDSRRAAPAGDGASQLTGPMMFSIFLRSLIYNVLFYLLLVFWIIAAIPTFVMPRAAILTIARRGRAKASGCCAWCAT